MTTVLESSIVRLSDHEKSGRCIEVPLDRLVTYAFHARKFFNQKSLLHLADSIREDGIFEPLLVRPAGSGMYEVIDGERRWRAARLAGLDVVLVLVQPLDDGPARRINWTINTTAVKWSTLELAGWVQRAVRKAGGELGEAAAMLNKSKSWVCKLAAIAGGGELTNQLIAEGVTNDSAVLATVASLERRLPNQAKKLGRMLKKAPAKANKRVIAERFMRQMRSGERSK